MEPGIDPDPGTLHTDDAPTVLLAVDDDAISFRVAASVTRWFPAEARVVVLHVAPVPPGLPSSGVAFSSYQSLEGYPWASPSSFAVDTAEALERGRELAQRAADIAGGVARVESGGAETMITDVATKIDADIIVVGSGERSWLSRLLDPSVSSGLVKHAPCSVLVVRDKHQD